MRQKDFGKTGIKISEFGLGTWAMGGGIYGTVDDNESIRTIHRAEELGVNFLDTAPMYSISELKDGRAERIIGRALEGRRDRWIIATKFGRHLNGNRNWADMDEDFSGARAVRSVDESLQRLNTDYIDVLFVHSPPREKFNPDDAFEAMAKLKAQGKIRVVAFSVWESIADTLDMVEPFIRSGTVEAVQVILNLLRPEAVDLLFPIVRDTGTAVVAREALANSFLTDSFNADSEFDKQDLKALMPKEKLQDRLDQAAKFQFLVSPYNGINSLPEAALLWTISHPEVSTVIPGAKTVAELEQCLSCSEAEYIPEEKMVIAGELQQGWEWD